MSTAWLGALGSGDAKEERERLLRSHHFYLERFVRLNADVLGNKPVPAKAQLSLHAHLVDQPLLRALLSGLKSNDLPVLVPSL